VECRTPPGCCTGRLCGWRSQQLPSESNASSLDTRSRNCSAFNPSSRPTNVTIKGFEFEHGRFKNWNWGSRGIWFTVDSQPLVEIFPSGQADCLSQVAAAESGVNELPQLRTLETITN
jgi:hypothetical protein